MSKAVVDTRTILSYLRKTLTTLNTFVIFTNLNLELFNLYIKEKKRGLKTTNKRIDNLIIYLSKDYVVLSDKEFVFFINKKMINTTKIFIS